MTDNKTSLQEQKVHHHHHHHTHGQGHKQGTKESEMVRQSKMSRSEDFVYVNQGYVGSMSSIAENRLEAAPPTRVIREQYWTCARWPSTQRILAMLVAILLGAVIGLTVSMVVIRKMEPKLDIFRARAPPD